MYEIIKNVVNQRQYNLGDILKHIDTQAIKNTITAEQQEELINLARENAVPENDYNRDGQMEALYNLIVGLTGDMTALTSRVAALESGVVAEQPTEPTQMQEDVYPPYKQPTGGHDAYHNGDKVTFNGKKYVCTAPDGVACVWTPATYPAYWQLVE